MVPICLRWTTLGRDGEMLGSAEGGETGASSLSGKFSRWGL